jgi:hypothetical protein
MQIPTSSRGVANRLIIISLFVYMAKVTGPFMSLDASGTFGKTLTAAKWKGIQYMRQRVIPQNPKTTDQTAIRDLITDASVAWKAGSTVGGVAINSAYKLAFDTAAAGFPYSGFNLFIKETVALNGGSAYDGSLAVPTTP